MGLSNRVALSAPFKEENMSNATSVSSIWREVRACLRREYGDIVYAAEIARLRAEELPSGEIAVICANEFGRSWVEDNLGSRLRALWNGFDSRTREILVMTEGVRSRQVRKAVSVTAGSDEPAQDEASSKETAVPGPAGATASGVT